MTDAERENVREIAKIMVDELIPSIIARESAAIGGGYGPLIEMVVKQLYSVVQVQAGQWIDEKVKHL